jgi:trehalose 6-phosphate phosphatase
VTHPGDAVRDPLGGDHEAPGAAALGEALREALVTRFAAATVVLMLDVDGTLAPIAPRPELAAVAPETRRLLAALAARETVRVALVSGRGAADARRIVGVSNLWVIGNHGAEVVGPDGEHDVNALIAPYEPTVARAARRLGELVAPVPGVILEDKTWTLSVHYRLADRAVVPRLRGAVEAVAAQVGLRVIEGKEVFEVRPPVHVNKGTAVLALARRLSVPADRTGYLFAGDDTTDEDAFRLLRAQLPPALTVKVGPPNATAAEFAVRDPAAVHELLAEIERMTRTTPHSETPRTE